jgi:hypothetical protein
MRRHVHATRRKPCSRGPRRADPTLSKCRRCAQFEFLPSPSNLYRRPPSVPQTRFNPLLRNRCHSFSRTPLAYLPADRHVEPPGGTPTPPAGVRLTGRSGHWGIAFGRKGNATLGRPPLAFKIGASGLAAICLRRVYHRPRGRLRPVRM